MPERLLHGLCDSCRHQRLVPNTRGSVFSRYPRVPVLACPGHEDPSRAGGGEDAVEPG
jgi:hypothetical protein